MPANKILVVDDEPGVRSALEGILTDEGFEVASVESGEDALEVVDAGGFDAVLLDVWLPGIDGLETLTRLRDRRLDAEVVMISGHGTIETAVRATKLGAFDFVEKPLSLERTLLVLRNALRQRHLERRNLSLLAQLARDTEIIGRSSAAESLRAGVEAAAASDASVLVVGERGSGRETVIRRIHSAGPRSEEAFVEVPCAALDDRAAQSALFGDSVQQGRLALGSHGSVFLENADRLAPELQERLAAHLGSREFLESDCRILATSDSGTESLEAALRERLEVVRIDVPPLRERREDVTRMVEHFMRGLAREYGREEKRMSSEALAAMTAYDWPGNVRELHNVVERLLLSVDRPGIEVADLPETLGGREASGVDLYGEFSSLKEAVREFERYYVSRILREQAGDRRNAAKVLGMETRRLAARLKALELD